MGEYEEYLIADLKTGLYLQKKPWLAPTDAFPVLLNAYIDEGVLKRRLGYSEFISSGLDSKPIVGFGAIQYAGYYEVFVCTTKRVYHLHQNGILTDCSSSDIFTGGDYDYFWFQGYYGSLYFCNGVDAIRKHTPNYNNGGAYIVPAMDTGDIAIQTCRMMFQYKGRLIIVSPKIAGVWYPDYFYYTDVNFDNIGTDNSVRMPIPDTPITGGYIGEIPVVFCEGGTVYHIVYTGNTDSPFTWDRRSVDFGALAKMGTASYSDLLSTIGRDRLALYDRYQIQNYDAQAEGICEQMHATEIVNSYAHKFADRNFLAISYTRVGQTSHDRILLYNTDDGHFHQSDIAAHSLFSLCGRWLPNGPSPGNYYYPPRAGDMQKYEFAGTATGKILQLNNGYMDGATAISSDIQSVSLNPYRKQGLQVQLGWLKTLMAGNYGMGLQVELFKNDSQIPFKTIQVYSLCNKMHWRPVFADGEVGDSFRFRLKHNCRAGETEGALDIYGFLLGCAPAGPLGVTLWNPTEAITTNWQWYDDGASLLIQYNNAGTWTTMYTFEDFSGTRRLYDDGTDLHLQELVDGTWTTKYTWEGVTGAYRWAEVDTNLELQWYNVDTWETQWVLES